jgi:N-(2-amino-2-carboxyethyl)-L-glutamate synthase
MLRASVVDCIGDTPLVRLHRLFPDGGPRVYAKLEFMNPAGSVKDRVAKYIVDAGFRQGVLQPQTHVVESTSGNFGVALAMMACVRDLRLTLVVDPNITPSNFAIINSYGAKIEMIDAPTPIDYLAARLERVREILTADPDAVWINQYANVLGPEAHYHATAEEILRDAPHPIDYLVVAVSTTGTLNGLASRLRESNPALRVVAVDAVGSVVFGGPPGPRRLPGIGSSRVPELRDDKLIDQVVYVRDEESVHACHELLGREAIFAGGSSGSVIAAIQKLTPDLDASTSVVTVLPDRGDRYLGLVYGADSLGDGHSSAAAGQAPPPHGQLPAGQGI